MQVGSLVGGAQDAGSEGLNFREHSCKLRGSIARVHGDCWRGFLPHEVDHGPGEDGIALQL